jgi:HK97 family phage prohead protease
MQYFTCPFEIKSQPDDNTGIITGYGSVFGNIDSYGDVVAKGAFRKSIADVMNGVTAWPAMLLQHGDQTAQGKTPIGIWTDMEEDERGLKLTGKLAIKTERGANAYALLKMKPRPALDGLSIGYRCTDYEMHKAGSPARRTTIKAVDLVEVSLVTFPANARARVTGVKSGYEATKPEYTMRDLALADYKMLCRELTKGNRSGW